MAKGEEARIHPHEKERETGYGVFAYVGRMGRRVGGCYWVGWVDWEGSWLGRWAGGECIYLPAVLKAGGPPPKTPWKKRYQPNMKTSCSQKPQAMREVSWL